MRFALVTLSVPPFDYQSFWWWILQSDELDLSVSLDLVCPNREHKFDQNQHVGGTSHCLNIFATGEQKWSERERVEFSVKSFLYLSKLHRKQKYDRIIIAGCDGAEPILVSNLSVLAPVWVRRPQAVASRRGELGYAQLETAENQFQLTDWINPPKLEQWPPEAETARTVMDNLSVR